MRPQILFVLCCGDVSGITASVHFRTGPSPCPNLLVELKTLFMNSKKSFTDHRLGLAPDTSWVNAGSGSAPFMAFQAQARLIPGTNIWQNNFKEGLTVAHGSEDIGPPCQGRHSSGKEEVTWYQEASRSHLKAHPQ